MKQTAIAPANIAFLKYWGKKDERANLPWTDTISMTMDRCTTKTTVDFDTSYKKDSLSVSFYNQEESEVRDQKKKQKVFDLISRIRTEAGIQTYARVVSENSFPSDAGIAASASAFAALTVAAAAAAGLQLSERELTLLARLGSGSACRSIPDGYVLWKKGSSHETSYAKSLYPPSYWNLCDLVAVVDPGKKAFSSTEGHEYAPTSEFFNERIKHLPKRVSLLKEALKKKDFELLGTLIEEEARSMHAIALSSQPPIVYWNDGTKQIISCLLELRKTHLLGYYTMDAGPNVHIICQQKDAGNITKYIEQLDQVQMVLTNRPCEGAHLVEEHLF